MVGKQKRKSINQDFNDLYPMSVQFDEETGSKVTVLREERHDNLFQKHKMLARESLDYKSADNVPLREFYRNHKVGKQYKAKITTTKWFIYFTIGVFLAVITFVIKYGVDLLQDLKYKLVDYYFHKGNMIAAFFMHYLINSSYALVGCGMVLIFGPMAGGSGIPEVKGYLNGVRVDGLINLKTFFGKVLSIIPAYASCLSLGPEGPMVHIGSMLGAGLSATKSRTLRIRIPGAQLFERLRTDREQRDFISSGVAAGIAAAFGAPIGGGLFALEEATTFWSRELTWRTFFGCMISALSVNILLRSVQEGGLSTSYASGGLLSFGLSRLLSYRYQELIPFSFLGVIGGLLGALFVKVNVRLNRWRRDHLSGNKVLQFLEVAVAVSLFSVITFVIPAAFGTCQDQMSVDLIIVNANENVCNETVINETIYEGFCKTGEFNDFANLFMIPQDNAIKLLFSRTKDIFSYQALAVFLVVYYVMVVLTAGLSIAAGLFVPMMLVGATYGRIVGKILVQIFPNSSIDPSVYALVGCASMMSGFSRTTISLCVIVVELTESTQFLLPIMLAIMCAKWIGDAFGKSIYEELMELKSITFLEHHPPLSTYSLNVKDIMASDVVVLNEIESLPRIVEILRTTSHNGFPVVKSKDERGPIYRGFVLRKQLLILIESKRYQRRDSGANPLIIDYEKYINLMNYKWHLEKITLPSKEEQEELVLNLAPYMDRSHPIVLKNWSYIDTYRFFQTQGLRHITVADDEHHVVGIITRHDLLFFHDTETISDQDHLGM